MFVCSKKSEILVELGSLILITIIGSSPQLYCCPLQLPLTELKGKPPDVPPDVPRRTTNAAKLFLMNITRIFISQYIIVNFDCPTVDFIMEFISYFKRGVFKIVELQ